NQAVMKEMDIKAQKEIQSAMNMYKDNYELQNKIRNILKTLNPEDHDYLEKNEKLKGYISILKGHRNNKERYFEMDEQGEFIKKGNSRVGNGRYEEKVAAKSYTDIYNKIVDELEDKYKIKGKKIKDGETGFSETDLMHNLLKKKMDNTVFNLIINGDDIVNTTGSAKQTGMIGGDSYMGHPGFGMSGLSFNKVTQRTYQAQDLLGEASLRIRNANGDKKLTTISEANSQLLKRMGTSGVGKRVAHYQTEQVVLDAIEHIRTNNNMSDMEYTRGQSYKTFAIGDVNTNIGKEGELNSFTASFQEGMTAAKSLQLTTNPIRNKSVILDLDKLDYDALGYSKKEVHDLLSTKETQHLIFEKIIDEKLYKTIEGKDKYSDFYDNLLEFSEKNNIGEDMDSLKKLHNYVNEQLGGKSKLGKVVDDEAGRMSVSSKIMNLLGTAEKTLGAISEAGGKFGKVKITNDEYTKDLLELKPEVGFRIGGIDYNSQTSSIEIALENIASVDQGSKQQTIGAKYTVSEVYDFLRLKSKNGEQFIDAVFNNKAERRKQTGMLIHGALQTVVTNIFEDLGEQGIKELNANMGELLKDLQVDVKLSKEFGVFIDETYLTKDLKGESITAEKFLELSKDPLENMSKIFTEKGKKIFEDVTKKYGYSYYTPDGKQAVGEMSHYGILTAMQKAYSKTYDKFGKEETAFIVNNASIEAFGKEGKVAIGNGPMLLLKLASERVNSNANKKKDGGLKLGTGISDMIRMSGYNELIDHIQTRNQEKVNNYLGSVFQNLSNSEIIEKIFVKNQDFNMDVLVGSIANSISNGVVFDLDKVKTTDYILNKTEEYLSHEKLMEKSILGKSILKKGLGKIENDSLAESVNVVIKDSNIQEVSNLINKDFDIVEKYLRNYNLNKTINLDYVTRLSLENKSRTRSESAYLKSQTEKVITGLKNTIHHMKKISLDTKTQNSIGNVIGIMKLFSENADNVYGLKQLQTMIFMGKILTTLELNYDVSSTDGTIVPNESFNRIKNLAEKSLAYKNNKSSSADF
ncbi:hypothetical protein, partial [uncultured Cetobacterium sp.]|uniref:hypothetical protein n=1 Tax=uncultured Cetobacterium sp. TaxID=527638 RepID=UPI00261FDF52